MKTTFLAATALAALLGLAAPTIIHAQSSDPQATYKSDQVPAWDWGWGHMGWGHGMMGPWHGYGGHMMGSGPSRGMMMGDPAQFIEGRVAFLRTELKITDDQKQLFDAFAEALRSSAAKMQPMHRRMRSGEIPQAFPDRIQWHIDQLGSRLQAIETVKGAAIPLYSALSDEQKKVADQLMMPMGPMMMM